MPPIDLHSLVKDVGDPGYVALLFIILYLVRLVDRTVQTISIHNVAMTEIVTLLKVMVGTVRSGGAA